LQPITYFFYANDCLEIVTICKLGYNVIATDCMILMQKLQNLPAPLIN